MKFTEFKSNINNFKNSCFYLFEGQDAFFRERGLDLLKTLYVLEPTLNLATFEGAKLNVEEVVSSLNAYPFMSQKRITLIREFYPDKNGVDFIKSFSLQGYSDSLLVILNEKANENLKKIENVVFVDCNRADINTIVKWIDAQFRKEGKSAEKGAYEKIAEYCLLDMTRISTETNKLISYLGETNTLTNEDVDLMVSKDTEYKIYELTDFIGNRKNDKALSVIYELLGKGETPHRLISSLYNYFRKLLHLAISDKPLTETANLLGMNEYPAKKAKQQSGYFKKKSLKQAVDILTDTDYKIKSGLIDVDEGFWLSLFKIIMGD